MTRWPSRRLTLWWAVSAALLLLSLSLATGSVRADPLVGARATACGTTVSTSLVAIALTSEEYDTHGFHSTVTNAARMTVPEAGTYAFTGQVGLSTSATSAFLDVGLAFNGTSPDAAGALTRSAHTAFAHGNVSLTRTMAAGDYVQLVARVGAGSIASYECFLTVTRLDPPDATAAPVPTFPTFPPAPEDTGPVDIASFSGSAAAVVETVKFAIGAGVVLVALLLTALLFTTAFGGRGR